MYPMCLSNQSTVVDVVWNQYCTAFDIEPLFLTHLKCNWNQSSADNNQGLFLLNVLYLILIYFAFTYSILDLITFFDLILKLYWNYSSYVYCLSNPSLPKLQWYEYQLLTSHTYNCIHGTESRWSLLFPIMHKVLSSYNILVKLDFILKNASMCINCIFN